MRRSSSRWSRNSSTRHMPKAMEDVEKLLNKNRIFIDRVKGVSALSREEAIAWSLTGPMARAAGVPRDIRKDEPYLCFADNWDGQGAPAVDFKVPVMTTGDVYARYLVRLEEMKQSLAHHPPADRQHPRRPGQRQPRRQGSASAQGPGLQQHRRADPAFRDDHDQPRLHRPQGRSLRLHRMRQRRTGVLHRQRRRKRPLACRTRPRSFINYQIFPKLIEGHMISDVVAVLGSINVIAAELDR